MKHQLNWRYAVLFALMAAGLIAVGGDTDDNTLFFSIKVAGLLDLWLLKHLLEKWQSEGKIESFHIK